MEIIFDHSVVLNSKNIAFNLNFVRFLLNSFFFLLAEML